MRPRGKLLEQPRNAALAELARGDQQVAGGAGVVNVCRARRADAAQPDLDDALHVAHLRRAAHRAE